jgi:hypothetical protein
MSAPRELTLADLVYRVLPVDDHREAVRIVLLAVADAAEHFDGDGALDAFADYLRRIAQEGEKRNAG